MDELPRYLRQVNVRSIPAAGAVIRDDAGRLLLVQRGHEPNRGLWSLPGGRVQNDETDESAVIREVRQETGLDVVVDNELGSVNIPGDQDIVYVVRDFRCTVVGGALRAGDDADAADWFTAAQLLELPTTPGLTDHLRNWGVLDQ